MIDIVGRELLAEPEVGAVRRVEALVPDKALWCMIETPLGVLRASAIGGASDRLAGFVAGTNDEPSAV